MSEAQARYRQRLLIEDIAELLYVDELSRRLPGSDVYPPYLLFGGAIFFDIVVLSAIRFLLGHPVTYVVNPFSVAVPLGIALAVGGIKYMNDNYADAVSSLRVEEQLAEDDHNAFTQLFSYRTKIAMYLVAVGLFSLNLVFNYGIDTAINSSGLVPAIIVNALLIPALWLPAMVEFVLLYFGIHVLLPRNIKESDMNLFHLDPRNMGGFSTLGQLLKRTYYFYTAGLLLFFTLTYGPTIAPSAVEYDVPTAGLVEAVFFTGMWFVGLLSMAYSMLTIHRVMKNKKESELQILEDELRDRVEDPYQITEGGLPDESEIADLERRIEYVRSTKEYPTTFTMWSQIAISVLLPQALQLAATTAA